MRTGGTPRNPQTFSSIRSFVFCRQAVAEPNLVRREWPKPSDPSSCQGTWPRGLVFLGTNMVWSNWVDQVWLVVDLPLWKIWISWVPNIWKCSKPPIRSEMQVNPKGTWYDLAKDLVILSQDSEFLLLTLFLDFCMRIILVTGGKLGWQIWQRSLLTAAIRIN